MSQESLLRDTFSVLRARKGSMYPRGPQVLEEDEEEEEEEEEGEEKKEEKMEEEDEGERIEKGAIEVTTSGSEPEKSIVRPSSPGGKASVEEECDVAEALATWKRRREERLER